MSPVTNRHCQLSSTLIFFDWGLIHLPEIIHDILYVNYTGPCRSNHFIFSFYFSDCLVYLCDFHREQAWVRWINKGKNGVNKEQKEKLLSRLRALARASNEKESQVTLTNLQSDEFWKENKSLQNWMNNTWLPEKKVSHKDKHIL